MSQAADDSFTAGLPLDTAIRRPRPGVVLLEVDGEVDTLTAPRMEAGLDAALGAADAEASAVVVDLSSVTFLASSGLAVLINGARRAAASGGRLHVVAATRAVARPIQVTGVDALVATHADVDSALAATAPPTAPPDVAPPAAGVGR
jgi:anti-sigma B factor antagonist